MNPARFSQMMKYLTRAKKEKPDLPDVFPASKAPIPAKTKTVEEMEAINQFMLRNPRVEKAGGGMLVQPSADGSRPGYADDKRGSKSKNPYLKDKNFLKYAKENFGWTPDMGTRGIGGTDLASMMSQYEKGLAVKNKIIGVTGLVDALGEDNPFSKDSILRSFSYADKKITKNMSVDQKSKIKMAKKIRDIILDVSGQPTTLKELYGPYKKIKQTGGNTRVFELSKRQINKINKLLSKDYAVQGMQEGTIDNIYNLFKDKKFINAVKKYEGGAVDIDSYLFKKVFEPGKGGKNSYAYMQLGRVLRGEIKLDGITVDKKLGNKIIKSIAHDSATNIDGEMGKAASRWAKFQMAKFFDDSNATYKNLSETVTSAFRDVGIKNFDLDEIFPARTGQITYAKGSGVYNQFIQAIDSKINQKSKRSFDGRMSSRLQALDPAYKLAQKTGDYSEVKSIIKAHDLDIENFYKTNPEAKGKVNLTKFRFDDKTKKFLSPQQVFESQYKGSYETIPSKIRKGMEKFYSKTGISIDPGTALTLEQAAEGLKGDKKSQAEILRKMGFEQNKKLIATLSKDPRCSRGFNSQGGRAGFQEGTPPSLDVCYQGGVRNINSGMKNATAAQAKNFAAFANRAASLGRGIMKYGIIPEALYVAADSLVRVGMGDSLNESLLRASEYLLPGNQTKKAEMLEADRFFGPEVAGIIGKSIDYKNQLEKVQSLEDQKANLENLSGGGAFDYVGDTSQDVKNIDAQLKQATDNLNNKFKITEPEMIYAKQMQEETDDARSAGSLFTKLKSKFRDVEPDSDIETLGVPEQTQADLNKRMLPQAPKIYKIKNGELIEKNLSEATQTEIMDHVQLLRSVGVKESTKDLLADQNVLRGMPISDQILTFGSEATLGFSGTMGEPINKPRIEKPQNVIGDMEKEIVGQTNVANPFDLDISDIGSGLRGFAAAGGGIAKMAGVSSGVAPVKGPNSQGLLSLKNRVRNY